MSVTSSIDKVLIESWVSEYSIIEFLQETIKCNTINLPGNELILAKLIQDKLNSYGIDSNIVAHDSNRANLVATIKGSKPGKKLMFSAHLDTVDIGKVKWDFDPLSGDLHNGRIHGRGSTDMKSGLVALLYTMILLKVKNLIEEGEIIFVATFGEETGSLGAKVLVDNDFEMPDAIIIGEPTRNKLITAHKGVLWISIEAFGKTGHSSMPAEGVNAVEGLLFFFNEIKKKNIIEATDDVLSNSTMVLTNIEGGKSINVIPDYCKATLDLRTLPSQDNTFLLEEIRNTAMEMSEKYKNFPALKIKSIIDLPSIKTNANSEIVQLAKKVLERLKMDGATYGINYFTDGSVFSQVGVKDIIILGPGIPELAHQPNEYVEIDKFIESIYLYIELSKEYLK